MSITPIELRHLPGAESGSETIESPDRLGLAICWMARVVPAQLGKLMRGGFSRTNKPEANELSAANAASIQKARIAYFAEATGSSPKDAAAELARIDAQCAFINNQGSSPASDARAL